MKEFRANDIDQWSCVPLRGPAPDVRESRVLKGAEGLQADTGLSVGSGEYRVGRGATIKEEEPGTKPKSRVKRPPSKLLS